MNNEYHMFCLSYIYLPRINSDLKIFQSSYNNHSLRTETHLYNSMYKAFYNKNRFFEVDISEEQLAYYGAEDDGPVPPPQETEQVVKPPTINPLSDEQYQLLLQHVNPTSNSADGSYSTAGKASIKKSFD